MILHGGRSSANARRRVCAQCEDNPSWGTGTVHAPRFPVCAAPPGEPTPLTAGPKRVNGMEDFPLIRELDELFRQDPDM